MPNVPNNVILTDPLPAGFDRADGLSGRLGTPDGNAVLVQSANGATTLDNSQVEEEVDSPTIERAEQATLTHKFRMGWPECLNRIGIYGRGALVRDSVGYYYRILSSTIQRQRGGYGVMTIVAESLSFDNPPDEFRITPVKMGIDILKHPRYFYALMPTNQIPNFTGTPDTDLQAEYKQQIVRSIQAYRENPVVAPTGQVIANITGKLHDEIVIALKSSKFQVTKRNPNYDPGFKATPVPIMGTTFPTNSDLPYPLRPTEVGDPNPMGYLTAIGGALTPFSSFDPNGSVRFAAAAAMEVIQKIWRLEDTPMINGWEVEWSEFSFRPQSLNGGSYKENPTKATPPLPDYFYSTSYPPNPANTIFDAMADINPQCYSANGLFGGGVNISWLRDADTQEYQRTWFKITRKWLGAPIGQWDADIYSGGERPTAISDYRYLIT